MHPDRACLLLLGLALLVAGCKEPEGISSSLSCIQHTQSLRKRYEGPKFDKLTEYEALSATDRGAAIRNGCAGNLCVWDVSFFGSKSRRDFSFYYQDGELELVSIADSAVSDLGFRNTRMTLGSQLISYKNGKPFGLSSQDKERCIRPEDSTLLDGIDAMARVIALRKRPFNFESVR